MQFKFLFFIMATFLVMESNAYIRREFVPANAAYPNKCFVERYSMLLDFGKSYPVPRSCESMVCDFVLQPGNKYELVIDGCGSIAVEPPCKLSKVDLNKVYPDCCPRPIC